MISIKYEKAFLLNLAGYQIFAQTSNRMAFPFLSANNFRHTTVLKKSASLMVASNRREALGLFETKIPTKTTI